MDKKIKVSVGIPAYNEEANIKNLVKAILVQKQEVFELLEIIIISDGSKDNTVQEVNSIQDNRINMIDSKERKGQAMRQNEILDLFSGDILVLLNADILPANERFLENFIVPFEQNEKVGIVGCKGVPLPAKTFFEKIVNFSVAMKQEMAEQWDSGQNIYMCHGHSRAFSRGFAKEFRWPLAFAEDAYSYLACLKDGFSFCYEPNAEVVFRSPQNFGDHKRQSIRFVQGIKQLYEYFPKKTVDAAHKIPLSIFISVTLKFFFKQPVLFILYLFVFGYSFIASLFSKKIGFIWEPSKTSKLLK